MIQSEQQPGGVVIGILGGQRDPEAETLMVRLWHARLSLQSRATMRGEVGGQLHFRMRQSNWNILRRVLPAHELEIVAPDDPERRMPAVLGIRVVIDNTLQPDTLHLTTGW